MGKLNVPPTSDPATPGRKGPAGPTGVGNESKSDIEGAFNSMPGPGSKRNTGDANLGFSSSEIHSALK